MIYKWGVTMVEELKKVFFLGISDIEGSDNRAYSNYIYALCKKVFIEPDCKVDLDYFKRHDMVYNVSNLRDGIYRKIIESDILIVLLDKFDGSFCENVWFELGLASTNSLKSIILISQHMANDLPFYAKPANVITIGKKLIEYFHRQKDEFNLGYNSSVEDRNPNVCNQISFIQESSEENLFNTFKKSLLGQIKTACNPFMTEYEHVDFFPLGYGSVYHLLKESNIIPFIREGAVFAEFIEGEEKAFSALTEVVENAKSSLRTSRSANQSIVEDDPSFGQLDIERNKPVHDKFMTALLKASKLSSISKCDRIICNNNYLKWADVKKVLCEGGEKTRIFIRKKKYAMGFELVVVDDEIAFIHFYYLNHSGDFNSDGTPNSPDKQVINSTLKISGRDVCLHLADVFERLHHRDFSSPNSSDPSRTLLGIPETITDDEHTLDDKYINRGCLKVSEISGNNIRERERAVDKYLMDKFKEWYKDMEYDDRANMALGIAYLNPLYAKEILTKFEEEYFPDDEMDSEKEKVLRDKLKEDIVGLLL